MTGKHPVLITGGAGYIGSHAVLAFRDAGTPVVVLDDLSTGHRERVPEDVPFVEGGAGDGALVRDLIAAHGIAAVVHFAGSIVVPESLADPLKYYRNNTCASRALIEACVAGGVRRFVFSSTAAVYGMPAAVPIPEDAPTAPINPYGASKLMTEWILRDTAAAQDFTYVALRYFNVAGADPKGRTGEDHDPETHLVPLVLQTALGQRARITIYGEDYDTPDGTCIRDYIHVADLVDAHVLALKYVENGGAAVALNLGNGEGFSVRQVVDAARRVTGRDFEVQVAARREGDPARLVADATRARDLLGWRPERADLDTQIADAWRWHRKALPAEPREDR
ncbi:MAG: UDP-glucose 4-epimerase GalE [Proteobacteria bacterium]|nr:UDP-glucose 4-epimerase GalE [Pseudomonadota bacterium]